MTRTATLAAPGAVSAEAVARFAEAAQPGEEMVYAWGDPDPPRAQPGFRAARGAYERGLVLLRWRKVGLQREYVMRKVVARARPAPGGSYAGPQKDESFLLDRLRRAARFHRPCPTNEALDAALCHAGFGERDASYLMRLLRDRKKIAIEVSASKGGTRRVVTILSNGARTARERG